MTPPTCCVAVFFFYLLSRQVNEKKTSMALSFYYIVYIHSINSWDRFPFPPLLPKEATRFFLQLLAFHSSYVNTYVSYHLCGFIHSDTKKRKSEHIQTKEKQKQKKNANFSNPRAPCDASMYSPPPKNARPCMHNFSSYMFLEGKGREGRWREMAMGKKKVDRGRKNHFAWDTISA